FSKVLASMRPTIVPVVIKKVKRPPKMLPAAVIAARPIRTNLKRTQQHAVVRRHPAAKNLQKNRKTPVQDNNPAYRQLMTAMSRARHTDSSGCSKRFSGAASIV